MYINIQQQMTDQKTNQRVCKTCNEAKDLDNFYTKTIRGKKYHETMCKKCSNLDRVAR